MALAEQTQEIPLNGGMDVKQSVELQDADTLRRVENLRWNALKQLEKRPTYASTATPATPSGYTDKDLQAIFNRGSEVFGVTAGNGLVTVSPLDPTSCGYVTPVTSPGQDLTAYRKYSPQICKVSRRYVERSDNFADGIYQSVSAIYSSGGKNILVFAWLEVSSTYRIRLKAVDADTGAVIAPMSTVDLASTPITLPFFSMSAVPYYEAGKEGVLIAYLTATGAPYTIRTVRYDAATKVFVADSNLTTNAKFTKFGLANDYALTGKVYFGFTDNTTGFVKAQYRTIGAVTTTHNGTVSGADGICFISNATATLIVHCIAATAVKAEIFGNNATIQTLLTPTTESIYGVTAALEGSNAVVYANAFPVAAVTTYRVLTAVVTFGVAVSLGATSFMPNVWLASSAFSFRSRAYCVVAHDPFGNLSAPSLSSLSVVRYADPVGTGALVRHEPVARLCHGRYYAPIEASVFGGPTSSSLVSNKLYVVSPCDITPDSQPNYNGSLSTTLMESVVEFANGPMPLPSVEVDNTTVVASGVAFDWDGDTPTQHGFVTLPRVAGVDATTGTGTSFATACSLKVIWKYIDSQGRLHRSAPSVAFSSGTFSNKKLKVYVTKPGFTAYDGASAQTLYPELYITLQGGSLYYLADNASGNQLLVNSSDSRGTYWIFDDVQAGVATNPALYTDSGELAAMAIPSFRAITRVVDRLWALDAEDLTRVWPSKPLVAGYAPEWNTGNCLYVGDDCVSIGDNNGIPTVFAVRGIWQVYGEGPDRLGSGTFSPPRRLPHEVGCIDPLICRTSIGTVFRGRKGFYALGNDLGLQPLGLPIDPSSRSPSIASYTHAKPLFDEAHNEIRIADDFTGVHWVYNVIEGKWSTWTQSTSAQKILDLCLADGRVWYIHGGAASATSIRREYGVDEAAYNFSAEGWLLQSPWIRLGGVAGFGRLWNMFLAISMDFARSGLTALTLTLEADNPDGSGTDVFAFSGAHLASLSLRSVLRCPPAHQLARTIRVTIEETCSAPYLGTVPIALRLVMGVDPKAIKRLAPRAVEGAT